MNAVLDKPAALDAAGGGDDAKAQGQAWATMLDRVARQLDRSNRQWTSARRKDSLRRLLDGSCSDPQRLLQRLQGLVGAWESDADADKPIEVRVDDAGGAGAAPGSASACAGAVAPADAAETTRWAAAVRTLQGTVAVALPAPPDPAAGLAERLATLANELAAEGATPERLQAIDTVCAQARPLLRQRHQLLDSLSDLCRELGAGLPELCEDGSWAQGQATRLQATLGEGALNVRAVRAAQQALFATRREQQGLRDKRQALRDALREQVRGMLGEVGQLAETTGRFELATAQYAERIAAATTLDEIASEVGVLLQDVRAVHGAIAQSNARLQTDHARAAQLEGQVRELESELRRLSDEASTDALTQVANRRGLTQAFEAESARALRAADLPAAALSVGLIDIDNFKKLNDSLGHAAGDVALKSLAAAVRERLRPQDHLARFGGEEFVLLLPATTAPDAQVALTRLQRSLTEALFLHEGREVFVTFSGGVAAWQPGETLEATLERADAALYEAKRSGKNRTCLG